jgi:hypothetical protein
LLGNKPLLLLPVLANHLNDSGELGAQAVGALHILMLIQGLMKAVISGVGSVIQVPPLQQLTPKLTLSEVICASWN